MNLHDFLEFGHYSIQDSNTYRKSFNAFLTNSYISPFFDAIMRTGSPTALFELQTKLKTISKDIWQTFEQRFDIDLYKTFISLWHELSGVTNRTYAMELTDAALREPFHLTTSDQVDAFQHEIIRIGTIALENEHRHALRNLAEPHQHFYSFEEYRVAAWSDANADSGSHQIETIYQRIGYFSYLEFFVNPFLSVSVYSENKKQASEMTAEIKRSRGRLFQGIKSLLDTSSKLTETKKSIFFTHARLQDIESARFPMVDLRGSAFIAATQERIAARNLFFETDPECVKLQSNLPGLRLQIQMLETQIQHQHAQLQPMLDEAKERLRPYQNYWDINFPRFLQRHSGTSALTNIPVKAGPKEIVYRNITIGEYESIKAVRQFTQAPGSLEREKWFYKAGASPGEGVSHPILCTIQLRPGSLERVHQLLKPDGQFAAVVEKRDAEPGCFGIHEDTLPAFNALIEKVVFTKGKSGEISFDRDICLKSLVALKPLNLATLPPAFQFLNFADTEDGGAPEAADAGGWATGGAISWGKS